MGKHSQADRAFRVDTPLGEDVLLLEAFSGQETVSQPFDYTLEMLSEDDAIAAADLLGQPVRVSLRLADGSDRVLHGHVNRFLQLGRSEELTSYRAHVVPWLWFLSLTQDCRVFQKMTVLEIVEEIFGKYPDADYEIKCIESYSQREYCVQYRESDLNFVSRLLEEEGILYFFAHSPEGHKLTLADDPSVIEPCPVQSTFQLATTEDAWLEEDVITELEREHLVHPDRVTLRDYDYLKPTNNLEASQGSSSIGEVYDYPAGYTELSGGERFATLLLEEQTVDHEVIRGTSTCRTLATGYSFKLSKHYISAANQEYLVVGAQHFARGGGYRTGGPETSYRNSFECIPTSVPYRPPSRAWKPRVQGSQTAVVVGPSGEEIYTDEHGRVKIQFHWDRLGKKDENSSCWVRVATPWAGKDYGAVSIPRIGNEVVVDFLEGNPDRPIIVGSVYNADQAPPHGDIQMGLKSRSSKGGGGYNEISLTDTKGKEAITIHGQHDMATTVLHNQTDTVKNDRTITVDGKHTETIKKDTVIAISEGNYSHTVAKGTGTIRVKDDLIETFEANQITEVAHEITIRAGDKITLITGDSSIVLEKNGKITMIGKNIVVEGKTDAKVEAPKIQVSAGKEAKVGVSNQQVTCDTTKVSVSGAAINSSAIGTHEIVGAVVKIN